MTGWGVERTRTAFPVTVASVRARTLMPPHSQGAERRARRTRWGLRALVIGGLAGAAWLLTGSAAQAADHDAAPGGLLGPSLIGAVVDGDSAPPVVDQILKVAARPLDRERPARQRAPIEALTDTLDEVVPSAATDADGALSVVDRVVREISGPLRLTGGSADSRPLAPVTVPFTPTLRPVTDLLHDAAPATAHRPAPAVVPAADVATQKPVRHVAADRTEQLKPAEQAKPADPAAKLAERAQRHSPAVDRHPAALTTAAPDTARGTTPRGDGPAHPQVHIGAGGVSTSGSGAPTEGGSAAYLPVTVAGEPVAHRSPNATDVGVRRHDAEAPTVSPD